MSNTTYKKDLHDIALAIANSTKTYVDTQDNNLQSQIDGINAGQNCADIVADLIALENYDVTNLEVGDKIEVLEDEQHEDASTVYSFNGTTRPSGTEGVDWWQGADGTYYEYVGRFGGDSYTKADINTMMALKADKSTTYTKTETDTLLNGKADLTNTTQIITADKIIANEIGKSSTTYISRSEYSSSSTEIGFTNRTTTKRSKTRYRNNSLMLSVEDTGIIDPITSYELTNTYIQEKVNYGYSFNRIVTSTEYSVNFRGDTLKITHSNNKLTYNNNEIIDTNNATTELFLTDAEMTTLLSEVFD